MPGSGVILSYSEDGFWETDQKQFDSLRRKHNPGSSRAQEYDSFSTQGWPDEWRNYHIGQEIK